MHLPLFFWMQMQLLLWNRLNIQVHETAVKGHKTYTLYFLDVYGLEIHFMTRN